MPTSSFSPASTALDAGLGPRLRAGAVLSGVLATFVISLAGAGLLALAVYATPISERSASAFLFALGMASLVLGAGYGAHLAHTLGWAHGLLVGLLYVAVSLLLSPLLFPGTLTFGGALQRLVLGAVAGTVGGVLGVNV